MVNLSLKSVHAVFILDDKGGERILAKYYKEETDEEGKAIDPEERNKTRLELEKEVFNKTKKEKDGQVLLHNDQLVLYRHFTDVLIYLIGPEDENELLLKSALDTFCGALGTVLMNKAQSGEINSVSIDKHYTSVVFCLDETIENGIILEKDGSKIAKKADILDDKVDISSVDNISLGSATKALQAGLRKLLS